MGGCSKKELVELILVPEVGCCRIKHIHLCRQSLVLRSLKKMKNKSLFESVKRLIFVTTRQNLDLIELHLIM